MFRQIEHVIDFTPESKKKDRVKVFFLLNAVAHPFLSPNTTTNEKKYEDGGRGGAAAAASSVLFS